MSHPTSAASTTAKLRFPSLLWRLLLSVALIVSLISVGTSPSRAATPSETAAADADAVSIHNAGDVRGNVFLPATGAQGSTLTWSSDAPGVVSADGVVTRPAHGEPALTVALSVTATYQGATSARTIEVTVQPLPADEPMAGYFFPHFKGESDTTGEEMYFAASHRNDLADWEDLNDGKSVLQSSLGEKGVRDPFIIRSPEGDRFYLLATDLNMFELYNSSDFGSAQERGSQYLIVWESTDLVNWSDERRVKVASDFAGNAWAPEAFWDEARGEYMVFWASATYPTTEVDGRDIRTTYQRMFYSTTRDFVNFTEPQVWVDEKKGAGLGMIDATIAQVDDTFYRVIKDEGYMSTRQDTATDLHETDWTTIKDRVGNGQPNPWGGTFTQGEGPSLFPSNTDPDHWYLLQDQPSYHGGQGYMLFETDDIATGNWTSVLDVNLPAARHGSIIGVTATELARLYDTYQPDALLQSSASVELSVQRGDSLQLPTSVAATMADGSSRTLGVTWDDVAPEQLQSLGTFFVEGTLDAAGALRARAVVTVVADPVPAASLTVTPETLQVIVGRSSQLTASVTPLNATGRAVTWSSSATDIATVDGAGLVRGVAPGSATITATTADGNASDQVSVTVMADNGPVLPEDAWVDNFDGSALDEAWSVVKNDAEQWSLTENPGSLTVHSLPGDLYQDANDYENVFMVDVPAGDFTAWTKLSGPVTKDFQGAGIVAWRDQDNYVRTGLTHASVAGAAGPVVIENAVETNAAYGSTFVSRPGSTSEWLQLQRTGNVISLSHWEGGAWVEGRRVTVGFQTTEVGLYALAAGSAPSHTVTFDWFALQATEATDVLHNHTIDVEAGEPGMAISETLYGNFFEDINYAADGGIYAELVRNRSFEFNSTDNGSFTGLTAWQNVGDGTSTVTTGQTGWLNENNRYFLTIDANSAGDGVRNTGFNEGVALTKGERYDFSVFARTGVAQDLDVRLTNPDGSATYGAAKVAVSGDGTWTKYSATLTSDTTTDAARLEVTTGAAGAAHLDMVSLFPQDTWVGPVNGRSVLRKDLAELVEDLNPKFLRFPGGCLTNVGTFRSYAESDGADRERTYQWKETIGAVEERPTNKNFWGYNQTYGIGYLEYFKWAEDLGAEPLPVLSVGANGCGSTIPEMTDPQQIQRWVDDTVDLIEFANGDATTPWGKVRSDLGHPAPFNLKWIGLGNEENTKTFEANFPTFRDAVKAAHPEIRIISNSGPDDTGARFDELWEFNRAQKVDLVDEHYYNDPQWFLENSTRYDSYDREGPHVFLGEYASRGNAFSNALSEAAYMTGLERNSDLVELASYAPMFANEDHVQWSPDMMWFDNDESWGSVNYYVQKMFMNNVGTHVVPSELSSDAEMTDQPRGGVFLSTWATQAAYDNVRVTSNDTDEVLFSEDFTDGDAWSPASGQWAVTNGEYVQTSQVQDARSTIKGAYDKDWSNYTLELDARKTAGSEGFLVGFAAGGPDNFYWWNIGGWNNTRSVLQRATGGSANELVALEGKRVVTGQTYRVKIEVQGNTIRMYLDGELQMTYEQPSVEPLYQVVTRDAATGDLLVKVVNPFDAIARTTVNLADLDEVTGVEITEMSGAASATNSKEDPTNVVPVDRDGDAIESQLAGEGTADRSFTTDFPARSITFLRISTTDAGPTTSPTPTATVTPTPKPTATVTPTPKPTVTASPKPTRTTTPTGQPSPPDGAHAPSVDVYSTPGYHVVNGRRWFTSCEPYSQTVRCRTEIWATVVSYHGGGKFTPRTGWHFNNLTYLPMMTRAKWGTNPLANDGTFTSAGRKWKTECDTPRTGGKGCRSWIWSPNIAQSVKNADGSTSYVLTDQWLFNNIVRFR